MRSSRDAGSRVRRFQPSFPFPAFSFLYIVYDFYNYRTVHRANMTDYVHRANGSNILHGMNALIAISDVGESLDCAAMAIGQSRHLGGGFLVPADFAVSVCQSDDDFEKGIPTWLK